MIEGLKYDVWEPSCAWGTSMDRTPWCLQYTGEGNWDVKRRIHRARGVAHWVRQVSGDVDTLSNWGRQLRDKDGDEIRKQFKILLSGSYEKRLKQLRTSLIVLCTREHYETAGGIGTCFVVKHEIKIYAELGNNGGIDVWGMTRQKFGGEYSVVHFASDCVSIAQVEEALYCKGFFYSGRNNEALYELLSFTKAGIPISEAKQTFVAKPKGRPRGGGFHVCTSDEFSIDWYELCSPIESICSSMETVHEQELQVDWFALVENQQQLMPKVWENWARSLDCYKDMPSLITEFPCGWCTNTISGHSMCCFTTTKYLVANSHRFWLESCLEFVANRLALFVESQIANS